MQKKICLILFLIMTAACNGGGEKPVANGPLPQIFIFPGEAEKRLISQETIEQNNCDGTAEMSQEVGRSHTVLYTLELGSGVKVEADGRAKIPEIGEVGVGVEVAANYQVGYGRSDTVSRAQTVAAAPNSHIQHTIQQFEIWETGEVLITVGEINQRLPYSFRRDFSIDAVAPANIGCAGGAIVNSPESNPETEILPVDPTGQIEGNTTDKCFRSDWEDCWQYDDAERTMTWIGPTQDSFDIGQKGVSLEKTRSGYTVIFSIQSSGTIETCVGSINGQEFTGECPIIYEIQPGNYQIVSPGPSGGFRVSR